MEGEGKITRFVVVERRRFVDGMGTGRSWTAILGNTMYRERKAAEDLVASLAKEQENVFLTDLMKRDGIGIEEARAAGEIECERAPGHARIAFGKSTTSYTVVELVDGDYLL